MSLVNWYTKCLGMGPFIWNSSLNSSDFCGAGLVNSILSVLRTNPMIASLRSPTPEHMEAVMKGKTACCCHLCSSLNAAYDSIGKELDTSISDGNVSLLP